MCPNGHDDAKQLVTETRQGEEGIYRRRFCCKCEKRYVTLEALHNGPLPFTAIKPKKSGPPN